VVTARFLNSGHSPIVIAKEIDLLLRAFCVFECLQRRTDLLTRLVETKTPGGSRLLGV
jgi:hypothetical protein